MIRPFVAACITLASVTGAQAAQNSQEGRPAEDGFSGSREASPVGGGSPSSDDPHLDNAYAAYQRGFYLTALREAGERLKRNPKDAAALTLMGELHSRGFGVRADAAKAAQYYAAAAQLGDINAAYALGMMYLKGTGVAVDRKAGRQLLTVASDRGHPTATYNLALVLLGTGDGKDVERAAALLDRASDADLAEAQYALAVLYKQGRGVARDEGRATALMRQAADHGIVPAQVEYAIMLFNGDGVVRDEAAAARFFANAAGKGNAIAQNRLARLLAVGRGTRKNLVESAAWHLAAAAQGLSDGWLDDALKGLSDDERRRAEELSRNPAGLGLGLKP